MRLCRPDSSRSVASLFLAWGSVRRSQFSTYRCGWRCRQHRRVGRGAIDLGVWAWVTACRVRLASGYFRVLSHAGMPSGASWGILARCFRAYRCRGGRWARRRVCRAPGRPGRRFDCPDVHSGSRVTGDCRPVLMASADYMWPGEAGFGDFEVCMIVGVFVYTVAANHAFCFIAAICSNTAGADVGWVALGAKVEVEAPLRFKNCFWIRHKARLLACSLCHEARLSRPSRWETSRVLWGAFVFHG